MEGGFSFMGGLSFCVCVLGLRVSGRCVDGYVVPSLVEGKSEWSGRWGGG